jgi:hypothetical protein
MISEDFPKCRGKYFTSYFTITNLGNYYEIWKCLMKEL